MGSQKVYDAQSIQYQVEVEDQGAGVLRQVVKVGEGGSSPVTVTAATVLQVTATTSSAEKLAANTSRKALSIFNNDTTETAYINIGAAATTSKIPIRPGEWWHMWEYGIVFTQNITAIRGASADVTLTLVHG